MKPVLIFRHIACEGPAYLARFLQQRGIPYHLIKVDEGEIVPQSPDIASALVFMGGPMSVNDDLPWIQQELDLIRVAGRQHLPVLGHCLGGQLISKALGGSVTPSEPEFGWFPVRPHDSGERPCWIYDIDFSTAVFHWHGESFTIPAGATPLFSTDVCSNQGFIANNMMALQCHVEIEQDDVPEWISFYNDEIPVAGRTVQSTDEMQRNLPERVEQLHVFADKLYNQWLQFF